jgi:hypothetical protein
MVKDGNDITAGPTSISMDSGTLSTGRVIADNVVTIQRGWHNKALDSFPWGNAS